MGSMEAPLSEREHETEAPIGFIHYMDKIPANRTKAAVAVLLGEWNALDESTKIRHVMDASFLHTQRVLTYLKGHLGVTLV
ncbi:hypothetical protein ISN44_As06g033250 [Arabidopsis suecica]|uniref:Uncharacterized protein n=1 Tax=Arabidopsis suecica TaxID=45249 RepID=A0A8T2CI51_ARASU|nr:hypothetical protein ISN44_As06g033250 [Arabidopsis suecica]